MDWLGSLRRSLEETLLISTVARPRNQFQFGLGESSPIKDELTRANSPPSSYDQGLIA